MLIDAGLDTGDMLMKAETAVGPAETSLDVSPRLAGMGAGLLIRTLDALAAGTAVREPQDDSQATWAPVLKKEDGKIDWSWSAARIHGLCRGFLPWPGGWTTFRGQLLHIWRAKPANDISLGVSGSLIASGRRLIVACGEQSALEIEELQLEGRKRMSGAEFVNGQRLGRNETLGEQLH
jgi:methionyl-tRNA formyltransferase